jgi:hypothetical protein
MFLWVTKVMASEDRVIVPEASDPSHLKNAIIEVFVLHLRNVIDFLYPKDPRSTDVIASDFCAEGVWQREISNNLGIARTRANMELAHMTSAKLRGASSQKGWNLAGLHSELKSVF